MRIFCLSLMFGATVAVAPLAAQQMRTGEAEPSRQDPLGFGGLSKDRPKGSKTEISAEREATFNEKENRATFVGGVRVKDPAFLLSADRLTVFLNRNRSGIDRAVAEGNVVIVQQTEAGEKGAVGRARRAEFASSRTHGPRMIRRSSPPIVAEPILKGLAFMAGTPSRYMRCGSESWHKLRHEVCRARRGALVRSQGAGG